MLAQARLAEEAWSTKSAAKLAEIEAHRAAEVARMREVRHYSNYPFHTCFSGPPPLLLLLRLIAPVS